MTQLSGMTGFARVAGDAEWGSFAWEAKSVNGRGLDVRVNVPPGFENFTRLVTAEAGQLFTRGSMQISLRLEIGETAGLSVNDSVLDHLIDVWKKRTGLDDVSPEALATLMTSRGLLEAGRVSTRNLAADPIVTAILTDQMLQVLSDLKASRDEEGTSLHGLLSSFVDQMDQCRIDATTHAATQPNALKKKLEKQIAELSAETQIDADRMAAEIALSAAKADVREELDRLNAHIATARGHLKTGSPVGRKLDFLSQELNREANTLCSKSVNLELTNAGLALKGLIDQFKEQAANVE